VKDAFAPALYLERRFNSIHKSRDSSSVALLRPPASIEDDATDARSDPALFQLVGSALGETASDQHPRERESRLAARQRAVQGSNRTGVTARGTFAQKRKADTPRRFTCRPGVAFFRGTEC